MTGATAGPRILIDPSSHHLLNAGDVAMLQVCVERLRAALPTARVEALTTAPELLERYCPGVVAVPATGRYALTASGGPRLPRPRPLARVALGRAGRRLAGAEPGAEVFARALLAADLLLLSGRGSLTDAFADETDAILTELDLARRIGLPVAFVGLGIGPLTDAAALKRLAATLPHAAFLALREGRAGPAMLDAAGVAPERIAVSGDDAIELAFDARPAALGAALGLNVRVADYAGMPAAAAERIGAAVAACARRQGAELVPVGISVHPHEDEVSAARGAGAAPADAADPKTAIAATGRCRVVVAGSYHAAVFALSQGVPVVGLAASPYYVDKLLGLRDCFGDGCRVVAVGAGGDGEPEAALERELAALWDAAPALRDELLAAAERQIALSRAAHSRAIAPLAARAAA